MKKLNIPTAEQIISANKYICAEGGNPHHCFDPGKIESSIHSAFYPGSHPFASAGKISRMVGSFRDSIVFPRIKLKLFYSIAFRKVTNLSDLRILPEIGQTDANRRLWEFSGYLQETGKRCTLIFVLGVLPSSNNFFQFSHFIVDKMT